MKKSGKAETDIKLNRDKASSKSAAAPSASIEDSISPVNIITVEDLHFEYYDEESESRTEVIRGVSMGVRQGEFLAVLGHNGSDTDAHLGESGSERDRHSGRRKAVRDKTDGRYGVSESG